MKLEVGMYVKYYQYRGKIGKIIKNYNDDLEIAYKDGILKTNVGSFIDDNYDINGKQYKASFDVIDLVEAGDYVNGSRVVKINCNFEYVDDDADTGVNEVDNGLILENNSFIYFGSEITSIVTKEQFEQMSYKVGE